MTDRESPQTPANPEDTERVTAARDAHGHNPDDYEWVPVLRKRRKDGWTPERQRAFISALADTGEVMAAARSVGMSDSSAYALRRTPGAESFAAAWEAALAASSGRLVDIAFDRAINGVDDPIINKEGRHIYTRKKYNDRLLMFLIRAHGPARYRDAHRDGRMAGEGPETVPACLPVAEALKLLGPEPPAEPEKLLSPEELADALEIADIMDGELPHWRRQEATSEKQSDAGPSNLTKLTINKLQLSDNNEAIGNK